MNREAIDSIFRWPKDRLIFQTAMWHIAVCTIRQECIVELNTILQVLQCIKNPEAERSIARSKKSVDVGEYLPSGLQCQQHVIWSILNGMRAAEAMPHREFTGPMGISVGPHNMASGQEMFSSTGYRKWPSISSYIQVPHVRGTTCTMYVTGNWKRYSQFEFQKEQPARPPIVTFVTNPTHRHVKFSLNMFVPVLTGIDELPLIRAVALVCMHYAEIGMLRRKVS